MYTHTCVYIYIYIHTYIYMCGLLGIHYRGVQWMGVVLYNELVYNIT